MFIRKECYIKIIEELQVARQELTELKIQVDFLRFLHGYNSFDLEHIDCKATAKGVHESILNKK